MRRFWTLRVYLTLALLLLASSASCWAECCSSEPRALCELKAERRAYQSACDSCCLREAAPEPGPSPRLRQTGWDPPVLMAVTLVRLEAEASSLPCWEPGPALQRAKPARSQGWSNLLFALPPPG